MVRRVMKVGAEGWPAGRIVEDKALYGPQGIEALDQIDPKSVVFNKTLMDQQRKQQQQQQETTQEQQQQEQLPQQQVEKTNDMQQSSAKPVEKSGWHLFRIIAIVVALVVFAIVIEVLRVRKTKQRANDEQPTGTDQSSVVATSA